MFSLQSITLSTDVLFGNCGQMDAAHVVPVILLVALYPVDQLASSALPRRWLIRAASIAAIRSHACSGTGLWRRC